MQVKIIKNRIAVSYEWLQQYYSYASIKNASYDKAERGWVFYDSVYDANERVHRADYKRDLPTPESLKLEVACEVDFYKLIKITEEDYNHFAINNSTQDATIYSKIAAILRFLKATKSSEARELGFTSKEHLYEAVVKWLGEQDIKYFSVSSVKYLKARITEFKKKGLDSVVYKKKALKNALKLDENTRKALLSIAFTQYERIPYATSLHKKYTFFLQGKSEIINTETGEYISPVDCNKVSVRTIENLLKERLVRIALEKKYTTSLHFNSTVSPFVHRNKASFSLAKLSLDDKVMRLSIEGGIQLWTYLVFDVYSGAIIGYSYEFDSKKNGKFESGKNEQLFKNCLINTFEFLHKNGLQGIVPWQVEVEQHIASGAKDSYLAENEIFPHVRFARGGNAQEKHAERFIRNFKYKHEAETEGFKARPFLRRLENVLNTDKKQKVYGLAEAADKVQQLIQEYNSDKLDKFFAGVRKEKMKEVNYERVAYWLGESKETTLRRNQYCDAFTERWLMPFDVDSWFFKLKGDKITIKRLPFLAQAYIYEGEEFICTAKLLTEDMKVNTAEVETTAQDKANLGKFYRQKQAIEAIAKDFVKEHSELTIVEPEPELKKQTRKSLYEPDSDEDEIRIAN